MKKMKTMKKMGLTFLVGVIVISLLLTSCTKKTDGDNLGSEIGKGASFVYPLNTDATLTYWVRLQPVLTTSVKNYGETEFTKEYQKQTGVKVEYIHPAQGQEAEGLSILIAGGDLPDIIETNWYSQAGGAQSAISNGTILSLNEYIGDKASSLRKYLDENPDIDKMIKTDNGEYYAYPFVRGDESLLASQGLMIRKDWLDSLGLGVPETVDEWTNTLKAFKSRKNAEAPMSLMPGHLFAIMSAYEVAPEFYVNNGKVLFGPVQPKYREFLSLIRSWYQEGLIDRDIAVLDRKMYESNMLNERSGATDRKSVV